MRLTEKHIELVSILVSVGCILALVGVFPATTTTAIALLLLSQFEVKFSWR